MPPPYGCSAGWGRCLPAPSPSRPGRRRRTCPRHPRRGGRDRGRRARGGRRGRAEGGGDGEGRAAQGRRRRVGASAASEETREASEVARTTNDEREDARARRATRRTDAEAWTAVAADMKKTEGGRWGGRVGVVRDGAPRCAEEGVGVVARARIERQLARLLASGILSAVGRRDVVMNHRSRALYERSDINRLY